MTAIRRNARMRIILSLLSTGLLLLWSLPVSAVTITAPKNGEVVRGTIRVTAEPGANEAYAFAMLLVNGERRSVSNEKPLRFEIDTTKLPGGEQVLQVDLADLAGLLSSSPKVKICVANVGVRSVGMPVMSSPTTTAASPAPVVTSVPAPQVPSVMTPSPVATPVAVPVPVVPIIANPKYQNLPKPVKYATKPVAAAPGPRPVRGAELAVTYNSYTLPVAPVVQDGRAMVLLRPLVEALGGKLIWDAAKKQAIAIVDDRSITFSVGKNAVLVDGTSQPISRAVALNNQRTVVPITVWHKVFGGSLQYDGAMGSITLYRQINAPPSAQVAAVP